MAVVAVLDDDGGKGPSPGATNGTQSISLGRRRDLDFLSRELIHSPMLEIDVERARADTPGCKEVIHLNNAGASLPPAVVTRAQMEHLRLEAEIGGYDASDAAHQDVELVYDRTARLLGCERGEVAFFENATIAWDMAFYGIEFSPGDRILTAKAEYASNFIAYLQVARRTGAVVEVVPDDEHGQLDVTALANRIDARVKLVSLSHVPTNGGLVNPAPEVGALTRAAGILFLLDACQSAGQLPLDVNELGCDILSATGRKYLRGPRGTGFLYVRRAALERLEPAFLDLHGACWVAPGRYEARPDARRFEHWETNIAAKIGLGTAVDYALSWGLEAIERRVTCLAESLRHRLADIPGIRVADKGKRRCGIVCFAVDDAAAIRDYLRAKRVNVSISGRHHTLLDMEERGFAELVRASVHYYNTEEELDRFCETLAAALAARR